MPHLETMEPDQKYEGFDMYLIRQGARALQEIQELAGKPEMLKAVRKYLEEEQAETKKAIELSENL